MVRTVVQDQAFASSRDRIIKALMQGPQPFTKLLDMTKLSKPVLARHLREMRNEERIEKHFYDHMDKLCYRLTSKAVRDREIAASAFSWLARVMFRKPEEGEDFEGVLEHYGRKVASIILFVMLEALTRRTDVSIEKGARPHEVAEAWLQRAVDLWFVLGALMDDLTDAAKAQGYSPPEQWSISYFDLREGSSIHGDIWKAYAETYPEEGQLLSRIMQRLPERIEKINKALERRSPAAAED